MTNWPSLSFRTAAPPGWRVSGRAIEPGCRWRLKLEENTVLHMDPDGHSAWVAHHDLTTQGSLLQRYDLDTGKFDEPVYHDADFDLGTAQLFFSRKDHKLAGFSYYQHRLRSVWLLPTFAGVQHAVDQNNPEWDNRLVDFDEQERRFVFRSNSPRQPDIYQLVDLQKKTDDTASSPRRLG